MNRFLFAALIGVTTIALIWGLSVVGGPGFARMESNDQTRASELRQLGAYYRCARIWQSATADGISPSYCSQGEGPPPDLRDPLTDTPYAYAEDDDSFEICATFEVPAAKRRENRNNQVHYEGQRGCISYYRTGDVWSVWSGT